MKMYLTTTEAQARGLPSVDEQIERYNQAVRAERSEATEAWRLRYELNCQKFAAEQRERAGVYL